MTDARLLSRLRANLGTSPPSKALEIPVVAFISLEGKKLVYTA